MPLIDLQTNLKSLKYGSDRQGGGDSGLPYIKVDINNVDGSNNRTQIGRLITKLRFTKFDDGLVRGGIIGAANASIVDTLRIGKFFLDAPKGPLFIVKQVGLQLTNPKLEVKKSSDPVSGFFNRLNNNVGPTRIYNYLGLNTLAQIPVNAFGGHFNRHGLLPVQTEDTKYINVVAANNENGANRLLGLTTKFKLGNPEGTTSVNSGINRARNFLGRLATTLGINIRGLKPEQLVIDEYKGGPGSVYGILGSTTINRTLQITNDANRISSAFVFSQNTSGLALINGERQPFTYIDPNTFNGAVSSGLGQRNRLSDWNKGKHIAGNSYLNLDFNKFKDIPTDPNEIAKAIGQTATNSDIINKSKPSYLVTPNYNNGLGKGSGSISQYPDSNDKPEAIDQTTVSAYSKSNPSLRKYAELVNQVKTINDSASLYTHDSYEQNKISGKISNLDSSLQYYTNPKGNFSIKNGDDSGFPKSFLENIVNNSIQSRVYRTSSWTDENNPDVTQTFGKEININKLPEGTLKDGKNNINALPSSFKYYNGSKTINEYNRANDKKEDADTMAIVFTPINPFTGGQVSKKFLAYLTDYSETYDSTWNDISYIGRAEKFYIFNSFKRTATIGLNIPCFNKEELTNNHKKLFALGQTGLAYALAGQYNEKGLLGGIITKITVGNYLRQTPGIISNLQFNIIDNSPWDLDAKYAQYIKCTFQFTIIGDDLPIYEKVNFEPIETPPTPSPSPTPTPVTPFTSSIPLTPFTSSISQQPPLRTLPKPEIVNTYVRLRDPNNVRSTGFDPFRDRAARIGGGTIGGGGSSGTF